MLVLSSNLVFSQVAFADDAAAAKVLFDKGLADMQAGNYEAGCKELAESVRLDRKPGALFTLATCEFEWGRLATAMARYDEFLQMFLRKYEQMSETDKLRQEARAKDAQAKRDQLVIDVPRWTITLAPNAPKGVEVKRNDETIGEAMWGVEVPVDPGEYVLTTHVPGGPVTEKRVRMAKGEKQSIVLDVLLPPEVKPPSEKPILTPPLSPTHPRTIAGGVFLGIGGVLLATGAIGGGIAMSSKSTADAHCGGRVGFPDNPNMCDDEGKAATNSARAASTVSTIGFVGAGIGAALGIILIATSPKTATPSKGQLVRHVELGLLSVGPSGVLGGVRGDW